MQHESTEMTDAVRDTDEIVEIEAAELDLREDLVSFSILPCCPRLAPSDRRLKVEVDAAGTLPNGMKLYTWRYMGGSRRFTGVMANELLADRAYAHAVDVDRDGLMQVDYGAIGYIPADFDAMRLEGLAALKRYRRQLN